MIIYKTTNKINGKIYIGKSIYNNDNYYGSGVILSYAIKKYGLKNFKKEIIEICTSYKQLNKREKYWIKFYKSYIPKIGYNRTMGGDGGLLTQESLKKMSATMKGKKLSKETKEKLSKSQEGLHIGEKNQMFGKPAWNRGLTKESSDIVKTISIKSGKTKKGKNLSEQHKHKLSLSHKGKNKYKKTDEHKRKLSESLKGRKLSEETKSKMSMRKKGIPQEKIKCPYCEKEGGITMYRWHFDNCKDKK